MILSSSSAVNLSPHSVLFRDITDDEACVDELRQTLRFFASVLVRRAQKVSRRFRELKSPVNSFS